MHVRGFFYYCYCSEEISHFLNSNLSLFPFYLMLPKNDIELSCVTSATFVLTIASNEVMSRPVRPNDVAKIVT